MNNNSGFRKVLGIKDVIVTAFGAMIGWGWVVSAGGWIQNAGVGGTIFGFVIGGLMIYFVGLVYSELAVSMPKCGGAHIFSFKALGPIGAFICTWAIILSYIGVVCFEACSLPTVIQYIFPGFLKGYLYTVSGFDIYASWLVAAILFGIIITYINIRGIKAAALVQTILTIMIAAVGIILVAISAINGDSGNLSTQLLEGETIIKSIKNILAISVVAPFFLFGFDVIPQVAEEINVPLKKLGKLLIVSILLAVSFYALVVFAVGYAMSPGDIQVSISGSGLVTADAMAKMFGNKKIMADVLILGGICGIITSWNSFMIGGSRAMYAMAESYMIPHIFARLHDQYRTPKNSLLLIGALSIIAPFFGREMLIWIANTASFSCCLAYCIVSLSFLIIRKKYPDMDRPFKIRNYKSVGVIAILMSGVMVIMFILPGTGCTLNLQEWGIIGGWTLLGIVFAIGCKMKYKRRFGKIN